MSLRTRLILSYVLIIVLCLSIVAASLIVLLGDQINRLAMARLTDIALPIYVQFRAATRGQVSLNQAWANLQEMSQETGTYIFLRCHRQAGNPCREFLGTTLKAGNQKATCQQTNALPRNLCRTWWTKIPIRRPTTYRIVQNTQSL